MGTIVHITVSRLQITLVFVGNGFQFLIKVECYFEYQPSGHVITVVDFHDH